MQITLCLGLFVIHKILVLRPGNQVLIVNNYITSFWTLKWKNLSKNIYIVTKKFTVTSYIFTLFRIPEKKETRQDENEICVIHKKGGVLGDLSVRRSANVLGQIRQFVDFFPKIRTHPVFVWNSTQKQNYTRTRSILLLICNW